MIIGIDHIALSCRDVFRGSQQLERLGFKTQFIERDLLNHPSKKSFLGNYSPVHDIAYCRREEGIAIELVDHKNDFSTEAERTAYHILFDSPPADSRPSAESSLTWESIWKKLEPAWEIKPARWISFSTVFWYHSGSLSQVPSGIRSIALTVKNFAQSQGFWQSGLGFRQKSSAGAWGAEMPGIVLNFPSPVKRWALDFILLTDEKAKHREALLDDPGFPCLALITTDIETDLQRLEKTGAREVSSPFSLPMNGKILRVAMLRGPSDEIVELIEFKASKAKEPSDEPKN